MTAKTTSLLGAFTLCAAGLLAAVQAHADKPAASASSSVSASATAAASAAAPAVRHRDLQEKPPPKEISDHPKPSEWKDAEPVALARAMPKSCSAKLLREWLKIRCNLWAPQAGAVLTGDTRDVYFFMVSAQTRMMKTPGRDFEGYVTVELPIRRGDRRLIQLTESDASYGGIGPQNIALLLSVRWLDDESGPTVTVVDP
jgi:hypothetical protein